MAISVQTTYGDIGAAFAGLIYDINPRTITTGVVETAAGINFGLGLVRGTAGAQVLLPTSGTDIFLGFSVYSAHYELSRSTLGVSGTEITVPENDALNVMRQGAIYVETEVTVAAGDPVFVRHTANGPLTTLGAVRNDADTTNALSATGWIFDAAADADAIVKIIHL